MKLTNKKVLDLSNYSSVIHTKDGMIVEKEEEKYKRHKKNKTNKKYKTVKTGFIDYDGNVIIELKYSSIKLTKEGDFTFCKNDKKGLISATGEMKIKPNCDNIRSEGNGNYNAKIKGKYIDVKTRSNTNITDNHGNKCPLETDNVIFEKAGKKGVKSINGSIIIEPKYDNIYSRGDIYIGRDEKGKSELISNEGKIIINKDENNMIWFNKNKVISLDCKHKKLNTYDIEKNDKNKYFEENNKKAGDNINKDSFCVNLIKKIEDKIKNKLGLIKNKELEDINEKEL